MGEYVLPNFDNRAMMWVIYFPSHSSPYIYGERERSRERERGRDVDQSSKRKKIICPGSTKVLKVELKSGSV